MKYIVVFDGCDPYICSKGCYVFNNTEEFLDYYKAAYEPTDKIYIIDKEIKPEDI